MIDADRRTLALADLVALQAVSDPQISPDGRLVAFVVETKDPDANEVRSRIWLVEAEAGAAPRPLTAGNTQDSQPRWSPDGKTLGFVSNRGGTRQIWLLSLGGGDPRPLTSHPIGAREPVWAPDGQRLAFLAPGPDRRGDDLVLPERDDRKRLVWVREHRHKLDGVGFFGSLRNHVWLASLTGEPASQLTDGPCEDQSPSWSPDGQKIAFVVDRSANRDRHFGGGAVHVVDVASGAVRRLTSENGRAAHPSWSPDGASIAYAGSSLADDASPVNTHLWIVGADGANARCLTDDRDRSVGQTPGGYLTSSAPAWTPDGRALLYLVGDGPSTHLCRVSDGASIPLTGGRLVVQSFSVDRSARRAALLVTDPLTPPEVCLWEAVDPDVARSTAPATSLSTEAPLSSSAGEGPGVRPVPLSTVNAPLLAKLSLAAPEDLRLSRPDGTVIEGWLLRPTRSVGANVPLILSVHGGPHNYFGDVFSFDHQLYAASGYAVLYANPRGSGGRGERFARAVCEDWGGQDFEDLMALLDYVIARGDPPIDERRVAITGSSYGGYMTCWAITQTGRFATAVAGACISNLVSFFGTSDIGATWGARQFGGTPDERLDWYIARSPVHHATAITTPLLLYHGESDLRCPIEQSEQMFTTLRRQGKPVEFLRVPTESHGVLNGSPAHRLAVRQAILDWFAGYLGNR